MKHNSLPTLVIIDEQFEKIEGHLYEYNKSVSKLFEQNGFRVIIYGHENMLPSIRKELHVRPWFTFNSHAGIRKIPIIGPIFYRTGYGEKFKKELKALLVDIHPISTNCILFFPNVFWYNVLPIAQCLRKTNIPIGLLFRFSIFDALRLPQFMKPVTYAIIKYSVKLFSSRKNTHYFSDSDVIAHEWFTSFNKPMDVLPIPHLAENKKENVDKEMNKIRMYLPGGMRVEKGVRLLTEAFEILARTNSEILNRIILVTQFLGKDKVLESYKCRIADLPLENYFLQNLSTEEYNYQLCISDAILIPYKVSEGYRARTSGVLAEAIASSKPFITTDGSWMSSQARKFDTGLVVRDSEPQDLADAICSIVNTYSFYAQKASAAREKWISTQSKEVFYQKLAACLYC